jgi:glycerol-3-phosphate dehydrogenase (NAD(P)+)
MTAAPVSVAVLGGGRWAKALARHLRLVADHEPQRIIRLVHMSANAGLTPDEILSLSQIDFIVLAVPAVSVRPLLRSAGLHLHGAQMLVHAIGNLVTPEAGSTPAPDSETAGHGHGHAGHHGHGLRALSISELVRSETPIRRVGALAGPALAQDLEERRPAALVCGSRFDDVCATARHALHTPTLRIYTTHDLIGVEVARASVAIVALCGGIADAMNLGVAARAILITRGAAELARLGVALGASEKTFYGLAGIGEMVVATDGRGSADFELGRLLIGGASLTDAQAKIGRVCDGPSMVKEAVRLAGLLRLRLPLCSALAQLVSGEVATDTVLARLLASDNHSE